MNESVRRGIPPPPTHTLISSFLIESSVYVLSLPCFLLCLLKGKFQWFPMKLRLQRR